MQCFLYIYSGIFVPNGFATVIQIVHVFFAIKHMKQYIIHVHIVLLYCIQNLQSKIFFADKKNSI